MNQKQDNLVWYAMRHLDLYFTQDELDRISTYTRDRSEGRRIDDHHLCSLFREWESNDVGIYKNFDDAKRASIKKEIMSIIEKYEHTSSEM